MGSALLITEKNRAIAIGSGSCDVYSASANLIAFMLVAALIPLMLLLPKKETVLALRVFIPK